MQECYPFELPARGAYGDQPQPDRTVADPGARSWSWSLLEGSRDMSGLMYRRNRYMDPRNGSFTQEDPIGLAGGLNLYGFGNGDPVTYIDPFGLKVEFADGRAQLLWNDLARRVNRALLSDDARVRDAASRLAELMNRMWHDEEITFTIETNNDPSWVGPTGGGLEYSEGPGRHRITVASEVSTFTNANPWVLLAHELGGADSSARGGKHPRPSVQAENAARTIAGCMGRNRYHLFDSWRWSWANPPCK